MDKRGYGLKDLMPIALIIVVSMIAVGIGADVVSNVQADYLTGAANCNSTSTTACGYAYNASEAGLDGLSELSSWVPTIALVLAAAIVIGILVYSFAFRT